MIIADNSRPDSAHSFDGKLGVWHLCAPETADRTSKNHKKGDVREQDLTSDHLWYRKWYTEELLPAIKTKMPWLQEKHIVVQQGGATPHRGKGSSEILSRAGKTEGWLIRLVMQPSNSPDPNIMDLCFFRSLKCQVMGERCGSVEEVVKVIKKQYEEHDETTLERAWQLFFVVCNQVHRYKGGMTSVWNTRG
ncbi:unnamed protein product [Choristocarpus tenellus]